MVSFTGVKHFAAQSDNLKGAINGGIKKPESYFKVLFRLEVPSRFELL